MTLIKLSQAESFSEDLNLLNNNKPISAKSRLSNLNPFIDDEGVLRIGGRLQNSNFSFTKKHPIILCSKHHLTKLIFTDRHVNLLHAGPQQLLASIRDQFWPIGARNLAKQVVHRCIKCFKVQPKNINPIMGNLPQSRVLPAYPFQTTGVDYAGPIMIKNRKGKGCKLTKAYICLFVCFITKSIHLELVTELTKNAFILALRRFVSRRGKPCNMYSDNGKNFVSANSELIELGHFLTKNENSINESINDIGINWHFIPAHSPHFGGLWEAGVKSMKSHLKRVAGNANLTFEELYTLLVQIEAILNSRPLSPLSSDPTDLNPITPAHFLVGRSLVDVPDPDVKHIPEQRLSVFQKIQQLKQHFWTRWCKEYVSELQVRTKWKTTQKALQQGTLVLIKDDNLPPLKWALGRITDLHPGKDNVCRVASIQTARGVIRRSFAKICPLPVEN